jgi:hypothetical protein
MGNSTRTGEKHLYRRIPTKAEHLLHQQTDKTTMSYHAPVDHVLVHGDALSIRGVGEDHKTESTCAASAAVPHDDSLGDLPKAAEVIAEAVLVRLPGDTADEDLPGVVSALHRAHPPLPSSPCNQSTPSSAPRIRTKTPALSTRARTQPHSTNTRSRAHQLDPS